MSPTWTQSLMRSQPHWWKMGYLAWFTKSLWYRFVFDVTSSWFGVRSIVVMGSGFIYFVKQNMNRIWCDTLCKCIPLALCYPEPCLNTHLRATFFLLSCLLCDTFEKFWQKQYGYGDRQCGKADASKDGAPLNQHSHQQVTRGGCPTLRDMLIQPMEAIRDDVRLAQ